MPNRFPPLEEYKAQYKARLDRQIEDLKRRGRYYVAAPRPKGYRLGARNQCFYNSAMAARKGKGQYVEGLFYSPRFLTIPHAWITTDGRNAIELTLRDTEGALYFGIEFDARTIARAIIEKNYWYGPQLRLSPLDFWPFARLS